MRFALLSLAIGVFEATVSVVRPWHMVHPLLGLGIGLFMVLIAGLTMGVELGRNRD